MFLESRSMNVSLPLAFLSLVVLHSAAQSPSLPVPPPVDAALVTDKTIQTLREYLQQQFEKLSQIPGESQLQGKAFKGPPLSHELQWITGGTSGDRRVTLTLQPREAGSSVTDLGLKQHSINDATSTDTWSALVRDVTGLKVQYLDPHLGAGAWLDIWKDRQRHPANVRIRFWVKGTDAPLEMMLRVPPTRFQIPTP